MTYIGRYTRIANGSQVVGDISQLMGPLLVKVNLSFVPDLLWKVIHGCLGYYQFCEGERGSQSSRRRSARRRAWNWNGDWSVLYHHTDESNATPGKSSTIALFSSLTFLVLLARYDDRYIVENDAHQLNI